MAKSKKKDQRESAESDSELSRKEMFIKELASYLARDQALMSIRLEVGDADAKNWAKLRQYTPLRGYPSVEEAEEALTEFLR